MYYRGTLSEFTTWHENVKIKEGLPKIGYVKGIPAPENQKTTAYVNAIQNPDKSDDYIWKFGLYPIQNRVTLTQADIDNLGWVVNENT